MPVFAWRNEPTRHFGAQPFPYASVAIQTTSSRWQKFSLLVDSGALVSLLCRSAGEVLGVKIDAGRPITLTGVGGVENHLFVHELLVKFGDDSGHHTRFAISMNENVPNLLGRLDVFDRIQVNFDPALRVTHIGSS